MKTNLSINVRKNYEFTKARVEVQLQQKISIKLFDEKFSRSIKLELL
jgi:hypothetical protein